MIRKLHSLLLLMVPLLLSWEKGMSQGVVVEAENPGNTLHGNVAVQTTLTGYSGTGYLGGFQTAGTDWAVIHFTVPATASYEVVVRYESPYGPKGIDFMVNTIGGSLMLDSAATFTSKSLGKFQLNAGVDSITINVGWGYYFIDNFTISQTTVTPPAKPTAKLSDSAATCATQALYGFLIDEYGKQVLTGQQDLSELNYIKTVTGKYPAIGCFDLIEYDPERRDSGGNPGTLSEDAIAWAKSGNGNGIVSLIWHWNAPSGLHAGTNLWWQGFYAKNTDFDIAAAVADTNSKDYHALRRDIDSIATQIKKFQAANIPVLWRPLHEPYSGGFWWGAKGSAAYIKLWQLMHDRLTNYHKLHNLIWVWSGGGDVELNWYPGDAYVDVVGDDIYPTSSSTFSGNWDQAQQQVGGKKLVALTETGTIPFPDAPTSLGVYWSWFSVWSGNYIEHWSHDSLTALYNSTNYLTFDELPDWRSQYMPSSCITAVSNAVGSSNQLTLYPNPSQDYLIVQSDNIRKVEVLSQYGQVLAAGQSTGNLGEQRVATDFLEAGMYFIKATYGDGFISVKSFVKK